MANAILPAPYSWLSSAMCRPDRKHLTTQQGYSTCRKLASRPVGLLEVSVRTVLLVPSMSSTWTWVSYGVPYRVGKVKRMIILADI